VCVRAMSFSYGPASYAAAEVLAVPRALLEETFASMRSCGDGKMECVVLWTGPLGGPEQVDAVVAPPHRATRAGYIIEPAWVTGFYAELRRSRRTTRAQVHTHPGANVEHSGIDEDFPLVAVPGFMSIVLPWFATRDISLDGAAVYEFKSKGWVRRQVCDVISWT